MNRVSPAMPIEGCKTPGPKSATLSKVTTPLPEIILTDGAPAT